MRRAAAEVRQHGATGAALERRQSAEVVIAKWLASGARVFLFDEPTRGIDIGAKVEVFQTIDELARAGAAILMVSSEMAEVQAVADRILVMRQADRGELPSHASQEEILKLAAFEEAAP